MTARTLPFRGGNLALGGRTLVMGIVNATPDSFSDGGLHEARDAAADGARRLARDGADILDLGGESTRPGHVPVSADDEWGRVGPVLGRIVQPDMPPVSIDTSKAEVARRALAAGAVVVNDVWGFQRDPAIAGVAAEAGAAAILMHNRGSIDPALDIVDDIRRFLERSVALATAAGVTADRIVLDPGLGFGKTPEQNFRALAALPRLKAMGFPVLIGLSRKRFTGAMAGRPTEPAERWPGTVTGNVYAAIHGADIIRVHDVAPHAEAVRMVAALKDAA